uniref:Uncharacterized protein MANES_13G079400 n=1 Tax=Rhizophora mucronata TaxID=61149 RepID=A0A2P2KTV7_RHIMU
MEMLTSVAVLKRLRTVSLLFSPVVEICFTPESTKPTMQILMFKLPTL